MVKVYLVIFSNDLTTLKPLIQFDEDRNVNVGLENHEITLEQCQLKPVLVKKLLLENYYTKMLSLLLPALIMMFICQLHCVTVPKLESPVIISKKPSLTKIKETFLDQNQRNLPWPNSTHSNVWKFHRYNKG